MPGPRKRNFRAVWRADCCEEPQALIADILGHFGSLTPLPGDGGLNVITHQVEIVMARTIREVNGSRAGGRA